MRFETFLAIRYLRRAQGRDEGRKFLRFITYTAIIGVAVGTAALLLSLAIVRGFSREIEGKIIGFGAHVQVESYQDAPLKQASRLRETIARDPEVVTVAPVIQEFVLLRRSAQAIDGVLLWGTEKLPPYIIRSMVAGKAPPVMSGNGVVIGKKLSDLLGIEVGDRVTSFSMRGLGGAGEELRTPKVRQFVVTGIYETSLDNFDELYVFADIDAVRSLLDYDPDQVTRFDVTLSNVERAAPVAERLTKQMGFPVMARTIYEVWRGLFAWVNLQESIIPLVIGVIIIVAAFNIVGTLLMVILEKTREIGVLESMGASPRMLRRLFIRLGLAIGIIGTVAGETIALVLGLIQQEYKVIPLPAEAYYMKYAPVALNPLDFLLVGVVALLLCVLAAYLPARVASSIDPIRVIRFR